MKHVDHQIQAYCDDELPVSLRQAFENHVRQCAPCRRQFEASRQLWQDVAAVPPPEMRRSVWPAVARRLGFRLGSRLDQRREPAVWTWPQRGLAAAAALAGVLIGFGIGGSPEAVNVNAETVTASTDYLEESLPSLDQLWLELGDPDEEGES